MKMKNWRTSIFGILSMLPVLWKIVNGESVTAAEWATITGGIGLIFSKDAGKTGVGF
jgi:hypothetical protein